MIKKIDVAYIHSPHGKQIAEWYANHLGLPIAAEFPGWTEFGMESGSRFGVDHTGFPSSTVQKQAVVLSFAVDDIHGAVRQMARNGIKFYPSPEKAIFDVGPSLVATFEDPDGNYAQLSQRKSQDNAET